MVVAILLKLLNTSGWSLVLTRYLGTGLISDGWKLNLRGTTLLVARWWLSAVVALLTIGGVVLGSGSTSALLICLALVLLLLFASLPLLANLLEFYERRC